MKVNFYDIEKENETKLKFAVICATYQGKWIYSKHKQRTTWETPGGHREIGESINKLGELPNLEIGEIKLFDNLPENLTYPQIQPYLYEKVSSFIIFCNRKIK